MHGDWLDVGLVVVIGLFAFSGYRRGFITGVLSLVGFVGGAILGTRVASPIASWLSSFPRPAVGLVVVFLSASIGQLVASTIGAAIRRRVLWNPLRAVDSVAGALLSIIPVLFIAWLLGRAILRTPYPSLVREVNNSKILTAVDRVIPGTIDDWFDSFWLLVERSGFPVLFGGIGEERLIPVAPPNPAVVSTPQVRADAASIVKVVGIAHSCDESIEGSGFVISPSHVLTNAHVVAGVGQPTVDVPGGRVLLATVVLYDPRTDIAVLYVPGLDRPVLSFGPAVGPGASAIVAGYPENGPFALDPARVRIMERVTGPDIYSNSQVTREVYALRALVRPGNSGGPMLSPQGLVDGVVFAAATDSSDTGYALTASQVSTDAADGSTLTARVSTQRCD
jgi:S1-C subfamily serine protease